MEILAIIPARSGSKGLPQKNLKRLLGKPLIEYTIKSAKNSKLIDRVIVTTDDKKIAEFSKSVGAEIPFLRPKKYAKNNSSQFDFINHALQFLKKNESYIPDIITVLHPTSPFRKLGKIDRSIRLLQRSKSDTVISVQKIKTHPYRSYWFKDTFLTPFKSDSLKYHQRQLFPTLYYPTGETYTFWYKTYSKYNAIYGPKIKPLLPEKDEIFIDIDYAFDLFQAEMTMKNWKKFSESISK
jgi:CMP-N,N'-diacetyllegionaminic acid synthase